MEVTIFSYPRAPPTHQSPVAENTCQSSNLNCNIYKGALKNEYQRN
jgi:hypothetical protein